MNIEEARKVLWLKSNPRSIGELLDGGYLTPDRLEWAAQWAYNFKLKQAAQVLLESMKAPAPKTQEKLKPSQKSALEKSLPSGISLDKARATPWPFPLYKGQLMGALVDSKQLSLKDLAYAAENAEDDRVRQAAITLSLIRLDQAVKESRPSAGFIHVISSGRSYVERKQYWLTFLDGSVTGLVAGALIFSAIYVVRSLSSPHTGGQSISTFASKPYGIPALVVALGIMIVGGWLIGSLPEIISKRLTKQIEEYRRGQEGEDRVVELVIQALDGKWHLFRNVDLPGRNKGDLDLVLVGPPGVWVLEVKNFRGKYRNIGENWEYRQGKKWKNASANPSRQALNNVYRLKNFLKADGLNVFVNGAVVWANEESPLFVENPSVAVWTYNRLADELGNIWQGEKITGPERKKIIDKLSKLCERAKKAHQLSVEEHRETG